MACLLKREPDSQAPPLPARSRAGRDSAVRHIDDVIEHRPRRTARSALAGEVRNAARNSLTISGVVEIEVTNGIEADRVRR
jgi:hypothetical protein